MQSAKNILVKQEGAIYTWLVFFLPVFILLMAFLLDIGMVYALQNRVQTALDISATSALAAGVEEDSLRQAGAEVRVERSKVINEFNQLLLANVKGQQQGKVISFPNGDMELVQIKLRTAGPPKLNAKVQVRYKTLLLDKVRQPQFLLDTETIITR